VRAEGQGERGGGRAGVDPDTDGAGSESGVRASGLSALERVDVRRGLRRDVDLGADVDPGLEGRVDDRAQAQAAQGEDRVDGPGEDGDPVATVQPSAGEAYW
jgi:hypothetical protein